MKAHATTTISIAGKRVAVDTAILPLIRVMNSIPGLVTTNCCQNAYVQFKDVSDASASTAFLQQIIAELAPIAHRCRLKEERYVARHGMRHGTVGYDLYFTIELGNNYCMRWLPSSYPYVLKAAKQVAKQMREDR